MTSDIPTRTVLVAAIDSTPASAHVIPTAVQLARMIPGAELHFVHVVDVDHASSALLGTPMIELLKAGRAFIDGVVEGTAGALARKPHAHLTSGSPAEGVLQAAADVTADLIVIGTNNKNMLERLALGSVSRTVMEKACCPVLVARAKNWEAGPAIDPPCPDCVEVQRTTGGEKLWCERHSTRHVRSELHYESPPRFAVGSMLLRPEG